MTVGGAEYMLNGHIVKIEKDAYWIRKASGDVVRVAVTEGTHLILSDLVSVLRTRKSNRSPERFSDWGLSIYTRGHREG